MSAVALQRTFSTVCVMLSGEGLCMSWCLWSYGHGPAGAICAVYCSVKVFVFSMIGADETA